MYYTLEDLIRELSQGKTSSWGKVLIAEYLCAYDEAIEKRGMSTQDAAIKARQWLKDYQFYAEDTQW